MSTSLLQHKILLLRENFRAQPEIEFLNCVIANIKRTDYSPTIAQYYNLRLSMIIRKHATAWKIKQCASFFLPYLLFQNFEAINSKIVRCSERSFRNIHVYAAQKKVMCPQKYTKWIAKKHKVSAWNCTRALTCNIAQYDE